MVEEGKITYKLKLLSKYRDQIDETINSTLSFAKEGFINVYNMGEADCCNFFFSKETLPDELEDELTKRFEDTDIDSGTYEFENGIVIITY